MASIMENIFTIAFKSHPSNTELVLGVECLPPQMPPIFHSALVAGDCGISNDPLPGDEPSITRKAREQSTSGDIAVIDI